MHWQSVSHEGVVQSLFAPKPPHPLNNVHTHAMSSALRSFPSVLPFFRGFTVPPALPGIFKELRECVTQK